ncbi:MAG: biotin--[acetyl-CoA-carboxylase] ligase [Clostridia bacterium]|jgi:BirA family biotin operon repressor/biotin-[acetyl-CoA-carboxylase] ligase|nr:biotin--[acetyl-CoA-carboxylase] ligase [Clostridia bacterium]
MQLTNLKTNFLGRNFIYYSEIDSTQDELWRRIEEQNIENGTLVMADLQTKGKGTHGRIWHTDESKNIAFSFYIETNCKQEKLEGITVEIAQILIEVLKEKYNISLSIKAPNDIVYNGKKLGGILTESKMISEEVRFLVIGIGLNTEKTTFTDDIKNIATSIKKEFRISIDRTEIIASFCNKFEEILKRRIDG